MFKSIKRGLAVAAVAALPVGFAVLPANASGLTPGAGPEDVGFSQVVTDGGGQDFSITGTWGHTYEDNAGNFRVTLYGLKINAIGINADDEGIDARVRVYSGYADGHINLIQDKVYDGADDPILLNPRNPLNRPEVTQIKISRVGIDGDGKPGAAAVVIKQPVIGDGVTP